MPDTIKINRAPDLTLWVAVVAKRLSLDRQTVLTLGQAGPQGLRPGRVAWHP